LGLRFFIVIAPLSPVRSATRNSSWMIWRQRGYAQRGQALFNGAAGCSSCHIPPTYTDTGPDPSKPVLHDPKEVGQDPAYAERSATKLYRTTPLRALWQHPPYFHDGSAPDLRAVVEHYDELLGLKLNKHEKADLVEFLKSI
jgi:cytochrome c peroxidase